MTAAAPQDSWRAKYLDCLSRLESTQQQYRTQETALKRIAGRLCIATLGLSPDLDDEVRKLQSLLKRDSTSAELDTIFQPLTDAIHALDNFTPAPAAPALGAATSASATSVAAPLVHTPSAPVTLDNEMQCRALLSTLLTDLKQDPELVADIKALDERLAHTLTDRNMPDLIAALTQTISRRIRHIQQARDDAEALLAQLVGQLDDMSQFLAEQRSNQQQSLANNESLSTRLTDEMKAMGEGINTMPDLEQIRTHVHGRLAAIGQHLCEFRQEETRRLAAMQASNQLMQTRIAQLESEARSLNAALQQEQQASLLDGLTRIPNRAAWDRRINEELQRWQRFGHATCIAAWDIDHFKRINDNYGHRVGDRVLKALAAHFSKRLRGTDFFGRYGGEEFVMILPGTELEQGQQLTDDLRNSVSHLGFHLRGERIPITISCGLTTLQKDDTAGSVFERADKALYQAKKGGRNRCVSG